MDTNSSKLHRRSIRLKGYDYASEGVYFITLVTAHRKHLFGEVVNGVMHLNAFGRIAREEWIKTQRLRPSVELDEDEFAVMPNHVHGTLWLHEDSLVRAHCSVPLQITCMMDMSMGDLQATKFFNEVDNLVGKGTARDPTPVDGYGMGDLQVARTRDENRTTRPKGPLSKSIGAILAGYKAAVTTRINTLRRVKGEPVWHRNYYEHIVNSEREYNNIVNYIYENPANWESKDEYFL